MRIVRLIRPIYVIISFASIGCSTTVSEDVIRVVGQPVDAPTGDPIPKVRVCAESVRESSLQLGGESWQQHLRQTYDNGKVDFRMTRGYAQTIVRIDTDGNRPFISSCSENRRGPHALKSD